MLILKNEYNLTEEEKKQVSALNEEFYKNDHELLHTKKQLKPAIEKQIDDLYFKYIYPLTNLTWFDPFAEELNDLKTNDPICGKNHNKKAWIKAYMLEWFANAPGRLTEEFLFSTLTSRKTYQFIIKNIYQEIK